MTQSGQKGFEGWYFKHQRREEMVAFIPGRAESGPFLQMISPQGARQFAVSRLTAGGGMVRADRCWFSTRGCHIELPGVRGGIVYGPLSSLSCDIMGPFRFLPMECRHGVISMVHTLRGTLWIDGQPHRFDGGQGYIEKDSGISFPRWYLWVQCNDFSAPCSVMLSVAAVPLGPISFRGCICALLYRGRTYRFATYRGGADSPLFAAAGLSGSGAAVARSHPGPPRRGAPAAGAAKRADVRLHPGELRRPDAVAAVGGRRNGAGSRQRAGRV